MSILGSGCQLIYDEKLTILVEMSLLEISSKSGIFDEKVAILRIWSILVSYGMSGCQLNCRQKLTCCDGIEIFVKIVNFGSFVCFGVWSSVQPQNVAWQHFGTFEDLGRQPTTFGPRVTLWSHDVPSPLSKY